MVDQAVVNEGPEEVVLVPAIEDKPAPVNVRYTVACEYLFRDGPSFQVSQNDKPLEVQVKGDVIAAISVIEVVTHVKITSSDPKGQSKKPGDPSGPSENKPETLEGKHIVSIERESLVIHSPILSELLRNLVDYYPGQNLTGDTVTIFKPFGVLAHHDEQLQELLTRYETEEIGASDESTIELKHLRILMDFVQEYVRPGYTPALQRLSQRKTPTVLFEDVWYVMRPGEMAYAKHDGSWIGCQIESLELEPPDHDEGLPERWEVKAWFLDNDDQQTSVSTAIGRFSINKFDGEFEITGLAIYPRSYFDKDNGSRRAHFEKRGELIRDILWRGHLYMHHDGMLADTTHMKIKGSIVVGSGFSPVFEEPDHDWSFEVEHMDQDLPPQPANLPSLEKRCPKLNLDTRKHSSTFLRQDHLFMMCPVMIAFFLGSKTWAMIHVDNISEVERSKLPPQAILDPGKQTIVEALSDYHTQDQKPWSADYIKNKGDGVVILLHGPPGVGKTYTVETTALRTHRPLISLTIAEIGTKEEKIESELTKWFSLAEQWRAILLIDECDIFLERRNYTDIARNGVVAAFLRKVEYFGGLLFLTTNRIGELDEAFMSRVHAVVGFDPLDKTSRKIIWTNLLEKLSDERGDSVNITPGVETYLSTDEILGLDWNGREIRNAFQTALVLAEHESKKSRFHKEGAPVSLEDRQFKQVRKMNQDFREYLESIAGEDRTTRAKHYYKRNDSYRGDETR